MNPQTVKEFTKEGKTEYIRIAKGNKYVPHQGKRECERRVRQENNKIAKILREEIDKELIESVKLTA